MDTIITELEPDQVKTIQVSMCLREAKVAAPVAIHKSQQDISLVFAIRAGYSQNRDPIALLTACLRHAGVAPFEKMSYIPACFDRALFQQGLVLKRLSLRWGIVQLAGQQTLDL